MDERQRLARDLHDSVSQSLWSAALLAGTLAEHEFENAEVAEQVRLIQTLTRGAVAEMRTLLLELRPRALEEAPLHELLEQLIAGLESRKDLKVNTDLIEIESISTDVKLGMYRIAQEAFNNISRHAGATAVTAKLTRRVRTVVLTITDNGEGFTLPDSPSDRLGLSIMQERASDVGAELTVTSEEGRGVTVEVVAPLLSGARP